MNPPLNLNWVDERLREWGWYFRDRRNKGRCLSMESRFKPHSEDFSAEGWGDMESAPSVRSGASYRVLRALETHEAVQELDRIYKWSLTYAYCYPGLPKFVVLKAMRKFTGRRLNWTAYLTALDIARCRVHTAISCGNRLTA